MNQWILVTTTTATTWSMTAVPNSPAYFALRAVDTSGLQSGYISSMIDDTAELTHYFLSSDGFTRAQLPQNAANVLRKSLNSYGTDLSLQWTEVPAEETGRVVRSMTLEAISDNTGSAVSNVTINPPVLIGIIGYSVANGQVVAGTPRYSWVAGTVNAPATPMQMTMASPNTTSIPASQASTDLSLFWNDGVEWVKTTGQVDTTNNALSFTGSWLGASIRSGSRRMRRMRDRRSR